ncbi:MAG: A/G-specific adenine glycosylase [Prolixibacteraceae bacterium]
MEEYRKVLTGWYNQSKRELPWRGSRDPYQIWVSEIILQQTRISQGTDYYHKFLKSFPDIESLAMAPEENVLKVWQGLGYYSRARNMHHAAKKVLTEHKGVFPTDYISIRRLKGIGDYTAAAISSIAFDLPHAVVDGNVYRVLSRLFGISTPIDSSAGKKEFYALSQMLLDTDHPGEFNQALMEFGAIQCLPAQPLCNGCPISFRCYAFLHQNISDFPVKSKLKKQKERFFNYLYLHNGKKIFMEKRADKDIWRNMFQFPLIESTSRLTPEEVIDSSAWKEIFKNLHITIEAIYPERVHLLTHQRLYIRFIPVKLEENERAEKLIAVDMDEIAKYPVPKPIETFLLERGH